jgi:acyl-CoA reductase-like NAD-dependent aldehyde dehydrogenase
MPQAERSRLLEKMAALQREFVDELTKWKILDHSFKESGFGKENSMYGLEEYTQLKVLSIGMQ